MERWQIIVACVAFIVIWMMGKRLLRGRKKPIEAGADLDRVEAWHQGAQDAIAMLGGDVLRRREELWEALGGERKLQVSEDFMAQRFGPRSLEIYSREEKLRIGRACVLAGEHSTGSEE